MRAWWQKWRSVPIKERLESLAEVYGPLVLVVWFSVFFATIAGFAGLIEAGIDWPWLESHVGEAGTWAAAYLIAKALMPLRVAVVVGILPFAARLRDRIRGVAAPG